MYDAELRAILEKNNAGYTFTYKGHAYLILSGLFIRDLYTKEVLMLGVDF